MSKKAMASGRGLTREQVQTVRATASKLMAGQREKLHSRHQKALAERDSSIPSQGEGPSGNKGKNIDPREWGNVNISLESLDLQAQAATLDSIHQQALRQQPTKNLPHRRKKLAAGHKAQVPELPAESRPITQIAQDSYLGAALCAMGQGLMAMEIEREGSHPPQSRGQAVVDLTPLMVRIGSQYLER